MFTSDLPTRISAALASHKPVRQQRARYAPQLSYGRHMGPSAFDARQAAVLLVIFQRDEEWRLPLTVRRPDLPDHAGQISLPGGMLENDESSERAALRETEEEIGISADQIQTLGCLSPLYLFNSNFHVVPWVGYHAGEPRFCENEREVDLLFEYPLASLLRNEPITSQPFERGRLRFSAPCFRWKEFTIWGATSMILGEFQAVLAKCVSSAE